jgi:hypothetical protein
MGTTDEGTKFLRIYLEDHLAGATAGAQRASRLAEAEANSTDAPALATFAADVATDLDALLALMETTGIEPNRLKVGLASVGEKLGALKPNGRVSERSPLSTIVELEAMQMAVRGKRSLWETLQVAMPKSTPIDLTALMARADRQLDTLSGLHAARVAGTFTSSPGRQPT